MKFAEFKEKMEGVLDFDKPEDCCKVIEMLLRDLDRSHDLSEKAATKLKMLAHLVVKDRPQARDKAEEILSGVPVKSKAQVWDFLIAMSDEITRAEALSDEDLLDDIMNLVWSELRSESRGSAVIEELIRRFKRNAKENAVSDKVS